MNGYLVHTQPKLQRSFGLTSYKILDLSLLPVLVGAVIGLTADSLPLSDLQSLLLSMHLMRSLGGATKGSVTHGPELSAAHTATRISFTDSELMRHLDDLAHINFHRISGP